MGTKRYETAYENQPEQVKHREERNLARAHKQKASGKALSGDVGHRAPLQRKGTNTPSNVHIETVARNRGWRKGQKGYHVPTEK